MNIPKLILDSIPFHWPKEIALDFYREVASMPVDIVVLGDTLCASASVLNWEEWLEIGHCLEQSGKQVIYSNMAFNKSDISVSKVHKILSSKDYVIEITTEASLLMRRHFHLNNDFCISRELDINSTHRSMQMRSSGSMFVPIWASDDITVILNNIKKVYSFGCRNFDVLVHGDLSLINLPTCQFNNSDKDKTPDDMDCPAGNEVGRWLKQPKPNRIFDLQEHIPTLIDNGVSNFRIKPTQIDMSDIIAIYKESCNI